MTHQQPTPRSLPRVVHFVGVIVDPDAHEQTLSFEQYHHARNFLVDACRQHGTVGSLGKYAPDQFPKLRFEAGDRNPDFYVIDDQLNYSRNLLVALRSPDCVSIDWFESLDQALWKLPGWSVELLNLKNSCIVAMAGIVMICGHAFTDCQIISECIEPLKKSIKAD
jgi:hypothetical protein